MTHLEERDRRFLVRQRLETGTLNSLTLSKKHFAYPGGPPALRPTAFQDGSEALGTWICFSPSHFFFSAVAPGCVASEDKTVPHFWPTFLGSLTPRGLWRRLPCLLPGGHPRAGPRRARKCPGVGVTCRNNLLTPRSTASSVRGSPVPSAQGRSPPTAQP